MTEVQERMMQLMDEIDEICQKEGLHYVLFGETAARAKKNKRFINSTCEFRIIMPLPDILLLRSAVEDSFSKTRAFETWEDNPYLHHMVFRYTDTSSLLINGWTGEYHTKPGVAITIFAARTAEPNKSLLGCERYLQLLNAGRKKHFWISATIRKVLKKIQGKKRSDKSKYLYSGGIRHLFMGQKRLARYTFTNQRKYPVFADAKNFWFLREDGKLATFPESFFSNLTQISFEGRVFPVPKETSKYLETLFGKNWRQRAYQSLPISNRIYVICDCHMPYEKYLQTAKEEDYSFVAMAHYRTEYNFWMKNIHDPAKKNTDHTFNRIKRSVDRIDVWHRLQPKRKEIRIAYQDKDLDRLRILLKEYLNKTEFYRKQGIGFYIDQELFDCAKLIWQVEKKPGYAEQVYSFVPELYRNETVDEYLAAR